MERSGRYCGLSDDTISERDEDRYYNIEEIRLTSETLRPRWVDLGLKLLLQIFDQ